MRSSKISLKCFGLSGLSKNILFIAYSNDPLSKWSLESMKLRAISSSALFSLENGFLSQAWFSKLRKANFLFMSKIIAQGVITVNG